ncbi:MarR family winged helix-turn-helix transcriptional regulator [Phaeodactylibacter luteus]|uniref:MarR family transcriptional regulator n=1 Tax=Phaeodactylibacter luteus TaxID=1564516 RepID=A0A5C6RFC3_9BACT|nr:winged helix DNA-binding protein [Phaeodactylibacter luteus]TXB59728.1 MarR family transcriptional regulator [Phaeodactylibacter luteus]
MGYTLLKALIKHVEEYQKKHSSEKIEDFIVWLNNELFASKGQPHTSHDELLIAFKLMHLNKSLKKEAKSVLSQSKVSSIDEYSFLLHLGFQESFRKMEIVELHNLEGPTGIDIIKRLIRNRLVEEFPDEEDRRAKRIKITESGIRELNGLKPKMDSIFSRFTEPLTLNEKIQISGILDKLNG